MPSSLRDRLTPFKIAPCDFVVLMQIMPLVTLLAGNKRASRPGAKGDAWSLLIIACLCLIIGIGITRFANENVSVEDLQRYRLWIIPAALNLFAGAVVLLNADSHPRRNTSFAGLCVLFGLQMSLWAIQEVTRPHTPARISRGPYRRMV